MIHIILVLTGYLNIVLIAAYTLTCFQVVRQLPPKRSKKLFRRQERLLLYFHFFCNLDLILEQREIKLLYFYGAQLLFLLLVFMFYHHIYPKSSRLLTNNMMLFMVVGLIMQTRLSFEDYAQKQFVTIVVCFVVALLIPLLMRFLRMWERWTWVYGIGGFLLLATVAVFGVNLNGASNWIQIAGVSIQPSEFAKILFVLFVACRLSKRQTLQDLIITTVMAALYVLVLVLETDLGGALIFFMVYIIMLYVATGRLTLFVSGVASGSFAAVVAYQLFSHVRTRVNIWRDPWALIDGGGWQICQSLFAIGTGSWFGLGLGQGAPESVPIVYSDFIFSALAEEMGTIFVLCLLLVYVSCLLVFLDSSMRMHKSLYKLIALGFGVCFIFQVFLNVGGAVKFIPLTGVTLPLISYGRSSVASVLLLYAITQGLLVNGLGNEVLEHEEIESKQGAYRESESD
jgi:cell division protein FtsW (lipid II flippase)